MVANAVFSKKTSGFSCFTPSQAYQGWKKKKQKLQEI